MHAFLDYLDRLLGRIPSDSDYGRKTRRELLDHVEDDFTRRLGADSGRVAGALDGSVAALGPASALESDYYREYARARYVAGVWDREFWMRPARWSLGVGALLAQIGLTFALVLPLIAVFASTLTVFTLGASATDLDVTHSLVQGSPWLSWPFGPLGFQVLLVVGLSMFTAGAIGILARAGLLQRSRDRLAVALIALAPWSVVCAMASDGPGLFAAALELVGTALPEQLPHPAEVGISPWPTAALVLGLIALSGWIWMASRRAGLADTIALRQGALALAGLAAGLGLASHWLLGATMSQLRDPGAQIPAPSEIAATMRLDFTLSVAGGLLLIVSIGFLRRVLGELGRQTAA